VVAINARNPPEAIGAIEKAMSLRNGGDARDWFLMAEARTMVGERVEAIRWFDKASSWMTANRPDDQRLRALRAEAASLLGSENEERLSN
jgi:hypothetical protein